MTIGLESVVNDTYNYQAPASGATVTLNDDDWHVVLDPAGGIAVLTVKMCANPLDGQIVNVRTSQAIATLTVSPNSGQSIANGAPTSLAAGAQFTAIYRVANTTWYVAGGITDAQLFSIIPQNSRSANYTTVLTDGEKHIFHPSADTTARTFTIDSNANVPYPIGTTIPFVNQHGAGVLTIAITSDTMRLAGAGTTGSRTLAADGIATALKITSTEWIISGTGLT